MFLSSLTDDEREEISNIWGDETEVEGEMDIPAEDLRLFLHVLSMKEFSGPDGNFLTVLQGVAANPNTPEEDLVRLSRSEHDPVKMFTLKNDKCPLWRVEEWYFNEYEEDLARSEAFDGVFYSLPVMADKVIEDIFKNRKDLWEALLYFKNTPPEYKEAIARGFPGGPPAGET